MKKTTLHQVSFFLFMLFISTFSFSQRGKNGAVTINTPNRIVNEYTTLTANAAAGATSITVAASTLNANGRFGAVLGPGDLIMIIQMQGATLLGQPDASVPTISNPNNATWGSITNYNNCGNYEFCQVSSVPNGTTINVDCGLIHNYTSAGKVQVVRVPRYSSLTISAPGVLTCQAWNGTTGGVLSVEVQGNTTITAGGKIKTTGAGFRGATLFTTSGRTTTGLYSCVSLDVGANKGESIGGYDTDYTAYGGKYCRAAPGNAGGGGNVWNCGGGGGANAGQVGSWTGQGNPDNSIGAYTTAWNLESAGFAASTSSGGGRGGYSFSSSDQNAMVVGPGTLGNTNAWGGSFRYNLGGLGGRPLDYSTGKLFLGGGGGAGEQDNGQGGIGGNGGGIIYLTCYGNITGSGNDSIVSDGNIGASTLNTGSNQGKDGAGGGGGGGTIILNAVGTIAGVAIRANGGKGGDQLRNSNQLFYPLNEAEGPGGGGGGGYIAVSNAAAVNQVTNGGANGVTQASQLSEFPPNGATAGGVGLNNQVITWDTIHARDTTICAGNTVTLNAAMYGTVPPGTTIMWYNSQTGGTAIATGSTFTTPVLNANTTYYVGFCPGTYRVDLVVNVIAPPNATITQQTPLCVSSSSVNLTAATGGGTWSGTGITNATNGTFDPAIAGVGNHLITYTLTTPCTATDTMTINVIATPDATINPAGPLCQNGAAVNLTAATPGGIWSGIGITNGATGTFSPSAAGPGNNVVHYTINSPCFSTDSIIIIVIPNPSATINPAGPFCVTAGSTNLSAVWPGGAWSGTGITNTTNGTFDPATAGVGSHTITYNVTGPCPSTDTAIINVIQAPNATINVAGPFCIGSSSVNLSAATSGGTWTGTGITNGTSGTFDPATAGLGSHTITYTVYTPCVSQDTIIITVNNNANPIVTAAGPYCSQDPSVNLITGTPGGTWSGTGITNTINGTFDPATAGVGTHQIIYTLGGACPGADTISVIVNASPNATITQAGPYCVSNGVVTLSAATVGGTWSGTGITNTANGSFDPSIAGAGPHVITYTIGGSCPATDTMTIVVTLNANATIASAGPYCANAAAINLSAATAGGSWTGAGITNAANGTFTPATAGVGSHLITYTITGACAATDTATIVVNAVDTTTIIHSGPYCVNNPAVTLVSSTLGGTWSGTGITNTSNGTFTPATAGVGSHLISYVTNGICPATDTFTVNVIPQANASINPVNAVCANSPSFNMISATPGGTWSGTGITNAAAGTFDPSVSGVGTFTITYAISGQCGDTATQTVRVNPLPTPAITASNQQGCRPLCTQFNETSNGCVNVMYNFGDGNISTNSNPNHCYNQSGTYNVSITCVDVNGCSATATVNNMITVFPAPAISISPDVTIFTGDNTTLTASGGVTYNWLNATALSCTNCANPIANPTQTTIYCVEVTDNNGCKDTACVTVTVDEKPCVGEDKWSVANAFSPNGDGNNDEFCLQGWDIDCIEYFHIAIYDRWGEKMYETTDPDFCWNGLYKGKPIEAQVLVYYIDAISKNKIELNKRGNISLIR